MKIGITGFNGFIGYHLCRFLELNGANKIVPLTRECFEISKLMDKHISQCDAIVHLAGINRHENQDELYRLNIELAQKLSDSLVRTKSKAHVLMSSSIQEGKKNLYGESKKESRLLLEAWAKTGSGTGMFSGLLVPNVFGPFGKPNYNSVVATFCHMIAREQTPEIHVDGEIGLIYVLELVAQIETLIFNPDSVSRDNGVAKVVIKPTKTIKVSLLLEQLIKIKEDYLNKMSFPSLENEFDKALFNTFRCYVPTDFFPKKYLRNIDDRGLFIELARTNTAGQTSFSTTVPGITRGNHYHTRKAERFAVIKGRALIQLRKVGTNEVINYELDGEFPAYVDMPIWYTHNIKNIGQEELMTVFWINEPFDKDDSDTYFEKV